LVAWHRKEGRYPGSQPHGSGSTDPAGCPRPAWQWFQGHRPSGHRRGHRPGALRGPRSCGHRPELHPARRLRGAVHQH